MTLAQQGINGLKVGIGLGSSALDFTVVYEDVTQYVRSISITRGKTDDFQDFSAGTASIVLDNRDRRFDPSYVAGPHFGNLKPRTRVIVEMKEVINDTWAKVFSGFIGGWPQDYDIGNKEATVTIPCYDLMAVTSQIEMPTDPSRAILLAYADAYSRLFRFGDFTQVGDVVFDSNGMQNGYVQNGPGDAFTPANTVVIGPELAESLNGTSSKFIRNAALGRKVIVKTVPELVSGDNSFAFGGWVQISDTNWSYGKFVQLGDFKLGVGPMGEFIALDGTNSIVAITSISGYNDNVPRHVMVFYEAVSGYVSIYVDGIDVTSPAGLISASLNIDDSITFTSENSEFYAQDWVFYLGSASEIITTWFDDPTGEYYPSLFYGVGFNKASMNTYRRFELISKLAGFESPWYVLEPEVDYQGTCLEFNISGKTLLQALQDVSRTEQGFLFCDAEGRLNFLPRYYIAETALDLPQMTFTDNPAYLPANQTDPLGYDYVGYQDFGYDYDDSQLANNTQVVIGSGDSGSFEDPVSISQLGRKSHSIDTLLSNTPSAQNMAEGLTNIYKDPQLKLRELRFTPINDYQAWWLMNMEIGYKINTRRLPQGIGGAIEESLTVLQIKHEITPQLWEMAIYSSARPLKAFFILDYSKLDGPDILGF